MVSTRTLLFALAASASSVMAAPTVSDRSISLSSLIGNIVCPTGYSLFSVTNSALIPQTAPYLVWKYAGKFCDPSWQGTPATSTTGTCNVPGSTRTFDILGLTLTEKLNANVGGTSPSKFEIFFYQQFALQGTNSVAGTSATNVNDFLSVYASGSGTQVYWETTGCATNVDIAKAVFSQVHGGAIDGAVAKFASS